MLFFLLRPSADGGVFFLYRATFPVISYLKDRSLSPRLRCRDISNSDSCIVIRISSISIHYSTIILLALNK